MKKTVLIASLFALLLSSALFYLVSKKEQFDPHKEITLIDGKKFSLATLPESKTVVLFWATTCSTCILEMPELSKMQAEKPFNIIAVSMYYDDENQVRKYIASKQFNFMFVHDNTNVFSESFGNVKFTPTMFVIDKRGIVSQKIVSGTLEEIKKII
ncbi:MAG: Redoxin domain protein [Proteobacteria bacterium]|nr:Redoxin domain protein [Pseudomonadota bacterium]